MPFLNPRAALARLNLSPGMKVLDVGAGSGAYALAAAEAVGESGVVYALDLQEALLLKLKREAERCGVHNLHVIEGDVEEPESSGLRESSVDAAILSNILSHTQSKVGVLEELKKTLKPKGRVLLVERSPQGKLVSRRAEALSKQEILNLFEAQGFLPKGEVPAGEHHYGFIFQKV